MLLETPRHTSVDGAEGQAQEAIAVLVLGELGADPRGGLDGLGVGSHTANSDGVLVDITAGRAAVSVADAPGVAAHLSSIRRGLVDRVTGALRRAQFVRENPPERTCQQTFIVLKQHT